MCRASSRRLRTRKLPAELRSGRSSFIAPDLYTGSTSFFVQWVSFVMNTKIERVYTTQRSIDAIRVGRDHWGWRVVLEFLTEIGVQPLNHLMALIHRNNDHVGDKGFTWLGIPVSIHSGHSLLPQKRQPPECDRICFHRSPANQQCHRRFVTGLRFNSQRSEEFYTIAAVEAVLGGRGAVPRQYW